MNRTFLNGDDELKQRGLDHLNSYAEDLTFYMNFGTCEDLDELRESIRGENLSFGEIRDALKKYEEIGSFWDYGLCFDYVELGTFEDMTEDYFRYQFCWGGPSAELRIYENWTEFVFLDWFVGVGFDVTGEDWVEWLRDWFEGCDGLNFQKERENYDYYDQLLELEEQE